MEEDPYTRFNREELSKRVTKILKKELARYEIEYDYAVASVLPIKTVGVKGDKRIYGYPAEVEVSHRGEMIWNEQLLHVLSSQTTSIPGLVRLLYAIPPSEEEQL